LIQLLLHLLAVDDEVLRRLDLFSQPQVDGVMISFYFTETFTSSVAMVIFQPAISAMPPRTTTGLP
jgi:hypothetical protein